MGTWVNPDLQNIFLEEYVKSWRSSKSTVSGKTLATYASQLKNHILPRFGDKKLTAITTSEIRIWVSALEREEVGPTTIRQSYRLLHQILESAVVDELLMRNPAVGVRLPKKAKSKSSALTAQQVNALAIEAGKYGILIRFLASTGLRINEALALRVEDIDLTDSVVHVERTWTSTESGKRILGQTKTGEVRDVPLTRDLRVELGLHLDDKDPADWVFQGHGGESLDYGYFRRAYFQPAVKKLELVNVTIHSLRHTAASLLVSLGTPILDVSRVLGHASAKMTLDIYGHSYADNAAAWVDRLGDLYAESENE
jgi:integrase